jgi:OmpA-OmpF porin, OOP family
MSLKKNILALAVLTSMSSVALAQSSGFYLGISGGQSKSSKAPDVFKAAGISESDVREVIEEINDIDPTISAALSQKTDKKDGAYKIYLGYAVSQGFALEGGYASLGTFKEKSRASISYEDSPDYADLTGQADLKASNSAWFLDAVGTLPVGNSLSLIGRVGMAHVKTKGKLKASASYEYDFGGDDFDSDEGSFSESKSKSKWVPKAGFGVEYSLTKDVALRAEYERYFKVGNKKLGYKSDVDMISVGLTFGF